MRGDAWTGLQLGGSDLAALTLDPQRADSGSGFIFQCGRQINDGTAGITGVLPTAARTLLIGGEEGEVDILKLLSAHTLDKADLVAHGFQLAERLVVIEQADVGGRKVALVQQFGDFLSLQGSCTHNGCTIQFAALRQTASGW